MPELNSLELQQNDPTFANVWQELKWRGLVHVSTDEAELEKLLAGGPVTYYCGFDPTAPSLHLGNLVQLLLMRRLQLAAHAHDGPAFVLRELAAAERPTATPLRLALKPRGADVLEVRILKRRGPPLEVALRLALPPVLSRIAAQRAHAGVVRQPALRPATFVDLAPSVVE